MKTVLVTGASGFIGKNLKSDLDKLGGIRVLCFDKSNTDDDLSNFVEQADFVFHLAGINRPIDEADFDTGNRGLTEKIIDLLNQHKKKAPLLITSSIQAEIDNPYGRSKKAAEEAVFDYGKTSNSPVYVFRLPNVFGKWSRPNYNSVVATFCHNISRDETIQINDPGHPLTLVYIDDVVRSFLACMSSELQPTEDGYCYVDKTFSITLGELADLLKSFRASRDTLIMPSLESELSKNLYATYMSYLPEDRFSYELKRNIDGRGWLTEFIKSPDFGQIFISKTKPGITRGNHWHHTKIEKFFVIEGTAEICFRNLATKSLIRYEVSGDKMTVLDIPAGYVHNIKNIGNTDLITVFWASEILNPDKPDTYAQEV